MHERVLLVEQKVTECLDSDRRKQIGSDCQKNHMVLGLNEDKANGANLRYHLSLLFHNTST